MKFNHDEVFEMAEELERNGARFYRQGADQAEDESARELMLRLAAMEDEHEKLFARMRAEFGPEPTYDPEGEGVRYLHSIMEGQVFPTDTTRTLAGDEDLQTVLKRAIGFEKDAILLFQSLKSVVSTDEDKARIESLVMEEVGHVVMLRGELQRVRREGGAA